MHKTILTKLLMFFFLQKNSFGHRSASKSVPTGKYVIYVCIYVYTNVPYKVWWWLLGLTNRPNVHTPIWKTCLKQYGRIQIDPAILAAIGHHFIPPKKIIKNADARVWGNVQRDQALLFWPNDYVIIIQTIWYPPFIENLDPPMNTPYGIRHSIDKSLRPTWLAKKELRALKTLLYTPCRT